jgi:hypothetical protein
MTFEEFVKRFTDAVPEGTVFENPGGGTTTIRWSDGERLCYQRGGSRFYVSFADLHFAYLRFTGSNMTTRDLKVFAPGVYDSGAGGHNCNATVLMLALQGMGLATPVWGRGRRGAPFGVTVSG